MTRVPRRDKTTTVRIVLVACAAVAAAAFLVWVVNRPEAPAIPDVKETAPSEPPPSFPAPTTEAERVQRLVELLLSGDTDDAEFARRRLVEAGEPARALVVEIAQRCMTSNRAFVEHAFDLMLRSPRLSDVQMAVEGLENPDPEVVKRSCILLGRVGGPAAREAMPRIAAAAEASWPLPRFALDALVALGGDEAVTHLERIATGPEFATGVREQALARLGKVGGERARTILRRELEAAKDDDRRIAAAEGLVALGDASALGTLRAMWSISRDERALALLARALDPSAFKELEGRIRAPLESEDRRIQALVLLEPFSAGERHEVMRHAAGRGMPREVRVEAWTQLWRDGDPTDRDGLLRLLRAEGPDAREDRIVAALVIGRVREVRHTASLLELEAAHRGDSETRSMLLRAAVLCGGTEAAEPVLRAIASDPAPHGTPGSLAYEVSVMLPEARQEFLDAAAPWVLKGLRGEIGTPGPGARLALVNAAGLACGPEAGPLVEQFLTHDDRHLREAAATVVVEISGPTTLAALRNAWWRRQDPYARDAIRRALERVVLARPVK